MKLILEMKGEKMINYIDIDNNRVERAHILFCMFCGQQVNFSEGPIEPCPHVLFEWVSEGGYEYKSNLVSDILPEDEFESDTYFIDLLLSCKGLPNDAFIIEINSPAFAGIEAYIGFSSYTE